MLFLPVISFAGTITTSFNPLGTITYSSGTAVSGGGGSAGTISNIQHVTNKGTAVTIASGISVTISASSAGNLLVADCNIRDNTPTGDAITVSDNQSQSWTTPVVSSGIASGIYSIFSFYKLSTAAGVTTVTFKPSGGGGEPYTSLICDVSEYATTGSGWSFDAGNWTTGNTSGNTESVGITTAGANDVIFSGVQNGNGDTGTQLAGFTNLDSSTQNGTHQDQHQMNAAAGSYTAGQDSAGITNGQAYIATVIAIKQP